MLLKTVSLHELSHPWWDIGRFFCLFLFFLNKCSCKNKSFVLRQSFFSQPRYQSSDLSFFSLVHCYCCLKSVSKKWFQEIRETYSASCQGLDEKMHATYLQSKKVFTRLSAVLWKAKHTAWLSSLLPKVLLQQREVLILYACLYDWWKSLQFTEVYRQSCMHSSLKVPPQLFSQTLVGLRLGRATPWFFFSFCLAALMNL